MCYNSLTIADYFIKRSNANKAPLSLYQLIKLIYIAHGWSLSLNDSPLISDEIKAWENGPVIPSLYEFYTGKGVKVDDLVVIENSNEEINCIKAPHSEILNKVYAKYGHLEKQGLMTLLHQEDTPWFSVWNEGKGDGNTIDDSETRRYYSNQITRSDFDSLSEYPEIKTKEDAVKFLQRVGILLENEELNPAYYES
ncbi:MAG: DUF4065 domain-containing protein [Rikenellaceae bacterium]|jgi:uncharacterized phage-associated protein|nr:DUF4065 domain-containing protein [Rikenellaceae bacterium]